MDPNANLREQLEIAERLILVDATSSEYAYDAERLAELVLALDGWLSTGGFPPAAWHADRRDEP